MKTAELTIDEAIKAAQEWQENAELAIPAEIVTGLVDGAVELREQMRRLCDAVSAYWNTPRGDDPGTTTIWAERLGRAAKEIDSSRALFGLPPLRKPKDQLRAALHPQPQEGKS